MSQHSSRFLATITQLLHKPRAHSPTHITSAAASLPPPRQRYAITDYIFPRHLGFSILQSCRKVYHNLIPSITDEYRVRSNMYLWTRAVRTISASCLFLVIIHPTPQSILNSIRVFFPHLTVVLVGELNCKRTNWNCISVDRNGRTLLYCLSQNIPFYYPDHPTYFHNSFQTSVLGIALSNHCILSKQLPVLALSSDHNPVLFKILLRPSVSESPPILDYTHANWPLFRSTLDQLIVTNPCISDLTDLEHTIQLLFGSASSYIYSHSPTNLLVQSPYCPS